MPSLVRILFIAPAMLAVARGQGVLLSAQGTKGTPASLAFQVDIADSSDANIINAGEITANIVNECGRTLLAGNIDIGENTETQLTNKTVTSVTKGSTVSVVMQTGSGTDGAGPYTCDMDFTSNSLGAGQTAVTVKETEGNNGTINLSLTMPTDLKCVGASTGNVCTVRCFNSAAAGPFGGCFAVQQTDITPNKNSANQINTAQTLAGVLDQVAQNQIDLPVEVAANAASPLSEKEQGLAAAEALLKVQTTILAAANAVAATSTATTKAAKATSTATSKKGKGGKAAAAAAAAAAAKANKGTAAAAAGANAKGAKGARGLFAKAFFA